jgi:hypothetical protein
MTAPDKKRASTGGNQVEASWEKEATMHALTTAACAVCFLLAFTSHGAEQLFVVALGGLLAGGGIQ